MEFYDVADGNEMTFMNTISISLSEMSIYTRTSYVTIGVV